MLHSVDLGTAHFFIKVTSMNHVSRSTFRSTALVISLGLAGVLAATAVQAKPFKWSSASDIPTLDIHSQNNALGNGVHAAIFDSLVYYNSKSFKVEPKLATSWKEMSPTQYRFNLRKGVKFSDGSALTADDVVFSLDRARAKTSNFNVYTQGFSRIVKVDANTVDIVLSGPNPVPRKTSRWSPKTPRPRTKPLPTATPWAAVLTWSKNGSLTKNWCW
jgi:peptide/nickel transport system substrate-binding protein